MKLLIFTCQLQIDLTSRYDLKPIQTHIAKLLTFLNAQMIMGKTGPGLPSPHIILKQSTSEFNCMRNWLTLRLNLFIAVSFAVWFDIYYQLMV